MRLRHNLAVYTATYVALAEASGANALLTIASRLARAPGARCPVVLLLTALLARSVRGAELSTGLREIESSDVHSRGGSPSMSPARAAVLAVPPS